MLFYFNRAGKVLKIIYQYENLILFSWAPKSLQMMTPAIKLKEACSLEEKL